MKDLAELTETLIFDGVVMEVAISVVAMVLVVITWFRVNAHHNERNRDMHYMEWWLRSMEERKKDRERDIVDEFYEE